jgi:hypothetical protein
MVEVRVVVSRGSKKLFEFLRIGLAKNVIKLCLNTSKDQNDLV